MNACLVQPFGSGEFSGTQQNRLLLSKTGVLNNVQSPCSPPSAELEAGYVFVASQEKVAEGREL